MSGSCQGLDTGDGLRLSLNENTTRVVEHAEACVPAMEAALCVEV